MMLVLVLGALVGAVLGLTGAGGGILAVPALVNGLGWTVREAAPVALIAVAAGAAVGALEGFRRGLVRYRAATLIALCAMPMTFVGGWLALRVPANGLAGIFGGVMLIVAWRTWYNAAPHPDRPQATARCRVDPASGRLIWTPVTMVLVAQVGVLTGLLTGLLGVGGGFVIVPALRRLTNLPVQSIVATSLLVIALTGISGVVSTLVHGAQLPAAVLWPFLGALVLGMTLGRLLAGRLSGQMIQRGFALMVLLIAGSMLWRATGL
ncbi:sulfite exporter TauE/SafE family protein [Silvimonas iriomotensis]|uniref:Probable membrane transporter protein n=1 Tax=Silvimonas iriomotensis TaxID=449662 RepID=A0ABQ2P501_9NEIS|nr:sulfite exporter TauE/SafE family protein [Silvimonas iriomotensis]GGP18513.1 UPF0721 transmembrane protein [Silvimonas iriomotensis]